MLTVQSFAPWLGVFETIRVEGGRPFFVEGHWDSLKEAARVLGLASPVVRPERCLAKEDGRWRWILTPAGLTENFQREDLRLPESITLAIAPQRVGSENWDARYKTLSYLTHWQARRAVIADEAVLLNERGEIASGAMSNIFWIAGDQIFTPALDAGCRAGVIREWVMRNAEVTEGKFPAISLQSASGIFVTNSWLGLMPVSQFEARRLAVNSKIEALRRQYELALSRKRSHPPAI